MLIRELFTYKDNMNIETSKLEKENKELKQRIKLLEHDLIHDELTKLKTRRYLIDRSKIYLKSLFPLRDSHRKLDDENKKEHIGFLFCDIDFFKKVNDSFGHAVGDEVLRLVSDTLKLNVREKDTVCRFGGEEILILLLEVGEKEAKEIAEKLRNAVASISFKKYPDLRVTVSIGVSSTEKEFIDESIEKGRIDRMLDEYVRRSDSAVYVAKNTGRNRVVVWSPELEGKQHSTLVRTESIQVSKEQRK